ncbi:MAG: excinuclease ABC subunit UvrC [Thermodesulfovibrionales bacterium]
MPQASRERKENPLRRKLSSVPRRTGVYVFKGPRDKVLYVGKAKDLRSRLGSYFQRRADLDPRKAAMVEAVRDFSFIVTDTELEALALESNLIKQHRPRFNVVLRDDKNYPYLKVTVQEEWPRIEVVRKIVKDGSLYFGPYVPAGGMWEALSFIRRHFNIRPCRYRLDRPMRPCVQFQIGRCPAPCAGYVKRDDYVKAVEEVIRFLRGEKEELVGELEEAMRRLSEEEKFEEAARVRDRLSALRRAWEPQKVISPGLGDVDVIGHHLEGGDACLQVFFIRNGAMIGGRDFRLPGAAGMPEAEFIHGVIETLYAKEIIPPAEIVAAARPEGEETLLAWLRERKGGRTRITSPRSGRKRELLRMAAENARVLCAAGPRDSEAPLREVKERLSLASVPRSIGAFDVSNISGREAVGSFVLWADGGFRKEMYRRVRIKGVEGADDYAMMRETVRRVLDGMEEPPDLLVIDGGRGHLEAARGALAGMDLALEAVALAKKPDRVFTRASEEPVDIEDPMPSSLLLKRIRDEAHRFAIAYHKKLRGRRLMESPLEGVPGIGKKRRLELLRRFGSLEAIRKAPVEEIAAVPGMNMKAARAIKEALS